MIYYFNTNDQKRGNIAFNEGDYNKALAHYKNALTTLNLYASQKNFHSNIAFKDALSFVTGEIIITTANLIISSIEDSFNYANVNQLWLEVPGLLNEMTITYTEICDYIYRKTTPEQITKVYTNLAEVCEAISDALIDLVEESEKETDKEQKIREALSRLKDANICTEKAGLTVKISSHIGYLNILERLYKCTQDQDFLNQITSYTQENSLLKLQTLPVEKLEILGYQLLVAVKSNNRIAYELSKQCQALMAMLDEEDKDSLIVEDINQLVSLLPRPTEKDSHSKKVHRKRRIILDDSDEEWETMETDKEKDKTEGSNDMEDATPLINGLSSEQSPFFLPNLPTPTPTPIQIPSIGSITQVLDTTFNTPFPLPITKDKEKVCLYKESQAMTLFAQPQRLTVEPQTNHRDAFEQTMKELADKYHQFPKFLANVLSLYADYFYKSKSLPFKKLPILYYELFENVLLLDKTHKVATSRIAYIYNQSASTKRMIDDRNKFNGGGMSFYAPQVSPKSIFCKVIADNIEEVDTYLNVKAQKVRDDIFDNLMQFIIDQIVTYNIAGSDSKTIAQVMNNRYKELLSTSLDDHNISSAMMD